MSCHRVFTDTHWLVSSKNTQTTFRFQNAHWELIESIKTYKKNFYLSVWLSKLKSFRIRSSFEFKQTISWISVSLSFLNKIIVRRTGLVVAPVSQCWETQLHSAPSFEVFYSYLRISVVSSFSPEGTERKLEKRTREELERGTPNEPATESSSQERLVYSKKELWK